MDNDETTQVFFIQREDMLGAPSGSSTSTVGVASSAERAIEMARSNSPFNGVWQFSDEETVERLQDSGEIKFWCEDHTRSNVCWYSIRAFTVDDMNA